MRIAVMGAGGIGGFVGGRLAAMGERVHFIARGSHLEALRRGGLRIESPSGDTTLPAVEATDDPAAIGPVDLVLFTVKLGDTEAAARRLAPLLGAGTQIVTLQNGVDSAAMLARHVGAERIAAGSIYISASIRAPGVIQSTGSPQRMIVDRLGGDPAVAGFLAACARAPGLDASGTDAIAPVIWEKFVALVAFSGITCLTRCPIGVVRQYPESVAMLRRLIEENLAVAQAAGQPLPAGKADDLLGFFGGLPDGTKSSMLVDLEAGKALEVPWLAGRIAELGQTHGVATPANAAVVAALAPHAAGRAAGD